MLKAIPKVLRALKGWRTLGFNVAVGGLAGVQVTDIAQVIPPRYAPLALAIVGVVNVWLRMKTDTPVGQKV